MAKEINIQTDAVRAAGEKISAMDVKTSYAKFPAKLTSSDGLVADGVNEIVKELRIIEDLVDKIIKGFPGKLNKVAEIAEKNDEVAASQFK